jgi:hypothetical protein
MLSEPANAMWSGSSPTSYMPSVTALPAGRDKRLVLHFDTTTSRVSGSGVAMPNLTSALPQQVTTEALVVPEVQMPTSAARMLTDIHAQSEFTWEQIAAVLSVDVRSVHIWRSGGRVSNPRRERMQAVWLYFQRRKGEPARELLYWWLISNNNPLRVVELSAARQNDLFLEEMRFAAVGTELPPPRLRLRDTPSASLHEVMDKLKLSGVGMEESVVAETGEAIPAPSLRLPRSL